MEKIYFSINATTQVRGLFKKYSTLFCGQQSASESPMISVAAHIHSCLTMKRFKLIRRAIFLGEGFSQGVVLPNPAQPMCKQGFS